MFFSIVLSYLAYTCVTAFTPGPNNILALYAVSREGWRKGLRTLLGITAGFLCVMLLAAVFCYELAALLPAAAGILKYFGAAYILWLAVQILRSRPAEQEVQPVSFLKGFLLEFVNVKIILYAVTVYTGYVLPHDPSLPALLLHGVCLTVIGAAGFFTWAAAGGLLQRLIARYTRPFNIAMAVILAGCALSLILG
ncbi:MAG: LysE family transporter [Clostridia bacterium]|nr:LysE family transporter [Clostridia bacterium]